MADKNVPSEETKNEEKNTTLKVMETKPKKAKKDSEPWTAKRILTTVIIAILALLMIGGLYYIIVMISQSKSEDSSAWGYYDGEAIKIETNNVFYNTLMSDSDFQTAYASGDYSTLMQSYYNAYQQQVIYTALSKEAKAAKIAAPQSLVDEMILSSGVYNDEDGNFSQETYKNTSDANKILVNTYYTNLYPYQVVLSDYSSAIVSQQEKDFVSEIASQARSFEYFVVDYNAYPNDLAAEYGKANEDLFKTISLSMISNSDEEKINQAYTDLTAGSAWADVTTLYSTDSYASDGGNVGTIRLYALSATLSDSADLDKIVALEMGSYTEPIKTTSGYAIYKIDSKIMPADFTDEETLVDVKSYLYNNESETVTAYIDSEISTIADLAQTDFNAAADSCNATIETVSSVSDNIGDSQYIVGMEYYDASGYLATATEDESVSRELFTADAGYVTGAISSDDKYVIAKVTSIDDDNSSMSYLTDIYYSYYGPYQVQTDKMYAILLSDKFEDNFYMQFLTQYFSSMSSSN